MERLTCICDLADPRGEFVSREYDGRTLIGEIVGVTGTGSARVATVRHFNGEPWPIEPSVYSLTWIKQA